MEIIQRALSFQDSHGHLVSGILAEPQGKPDGVVILCHGFLSTKQSNTNRRLTDLLVPQGISTFCFDWFGMGESEGAFADITVGRCCDQLKQALAFISRSRLSTYWSDRFELWRVNFHFGCRPISPPSGTRTQMPRSRFPRAASIGVR